MRTKFMWLTATLLVMVILATGGQGGAQPPEKKGDPPKKFGPKKGKGGPARDLTTDDVAAYLLAFDKNGSGKVTRDQLPERMQHLVDQGDTNKDGCLDKEEILALAAKLAREPRPKQFGDKGFGKKKKKGPGQE
jgi:hypothetical protein